VQPENVSLQISVTLSGMIIEVRPVQRSNADSLIVSTLSGMSIEVMNSPFHPTGLPSTRVLFFADQNILC